MKAMKKFCLIAILVLALVGLFVLVGCDGVNVDDESGTFDIKIEGSVKLTVSGQLIGKQTFASAEEIASTIETASGGMVKANALSGRIVVADSAVYRIELTDIPSETDVRAYIDGKKREYAAAFADWTVFPNSPAYYSTVNGKDIVVFFDSSADNAEIDIYVLYFESGAVREIAAAIASQGGGESGESGESGGNGGSGSGGNNGGGSTIGGNGNVAGDGSGKTNQGGNEGGGENGGEGEGGIGGGDPNDGEPQTPQYVRYKVIDVDKEGNQSDYISDTVKYGVEFKFDWCSFVVFRDPAFKEEINPNETFELTEDITVYRRDNLDRVPVFVTIHHIINGIEYDQEHFIYFRGELVSEKSKMRGGYEYEIYRDSEKSENLFANGVVVIRDSDEKGHFYAFREDPNFHKVTFKLGGSELGTVLMYEGEMITQYSALVFRGTREYMIVDCTGFEERVTSDMTVTITEYRTLNNFPITVHCCYEGDIKYSYINYETVSDEGVDFGEGAGYYTDIECKQPFTGTVKTATTFYSKIGVNLDRFAGL